MVISPQLFITLLLLLCSAPLYADTPARWSYDGDQDGQHNWGVLSPDYAKCEIGKEQSPILIARTEIADLPALHFQYSYGLAHGQSSINGPIVTFDGNQSLLYDNVVYHLRQMTIHTPAEHIANRQSHNAEFEFLHQSDDNKILIVSIFGDFGRYPPAALQTLLNHMPKSPKEKETAFRLDPGGFIPKEKSYYTYTGSLTTPPCTEGVQWIVMKRKIGFREAQFKKIIALSHRNARSIQPAYFREVKETRD